MLCGCGLYSQPPRPCAVCIPHSHLGMRASWKYYKSPGSFWESHKRTQNLHKALMSCCGKEYLEKMCVKQWKEEFAIELPTNGPSILIDTNFHAFETLPG